MSESFRSGQIATQSGVYRVLDETGIEIVAKRYITAGKRFPPTLSRGQHFVLVRPVTVIYTSTSSADALGTATETHINVLKRLAKK